MKDLKITKGEWVYSKYTCDYGVYSEEGDGRDIALVRSRNDEEESEANVKLITAAPDMLQILMFIDDAAIRGISIDNKSSLHRDIMDAISKATE